MYPKDIDINSRQMSYSEFVSHFNLKFPDTFTNDDFTPDYHFLERQLLNMDTWNRGEISIFGIEKTSKTDTTLRILDKQNIDKFRTLFEFIELESFKLQDMKIYKDFNGLSFSDLQGQYRRRLKGITINLYYLYDNYSEEEIKILEELCS